VVNYFVNGHQIDFNATVCKIMYHVLTHQDSMPGAFETEEGKGIDKSTAPTKHMSQTKASLTHLWLGV
jgi:hypothetical protein